ncbi:cytochrome c3 family protein [Ideonella sp.]|uniref:cytochrome c3 family protein n=1 Tax=Ideonella sp. TaxID=1929293 RepID=UPI002B4A6A67|nr:cytochrome c3 family protein [Ideonella sp.]HJV69069.1 cytochrome c3 family protein [Ideonella sp.]
MKGRWLLAVIAANLAVLVGLVFAYPEFMVSPGHLSRGHAELATDCFACHAPWRGAASALCIECHATADIGLRTTKGVALPRKGLKTSFHQELIEQDCVACHSDHQGPKLSQRSRKPFSHALLRPIVRERCDSCHDAPDDKLHRKITGNCGSCHTADRWKPATFEHDRFFVLDRDHDTDCVTCHEANDYSRYTCYGCHEHTEANIRGEHEEEGISDFTDCVECHRDPGVEPDERGRGGGRREREDD